jgi:hypothetical protein
VVIADRLRWSGVDCGGHGRGERGAGAADKPAQVAAFGEQLTASDAQSGLKFFVGRFEFLVGGLAELVARGGVEAWARPPRSACWRG